MAPILIYLTVMHKNAPALLILISALCFIGASIVPGNFTDKSLQWCRSTNLWGFPIHENGTIIYDSTKTQPGINLLDNMLCCIMMDMNGKVLKYFPIGLANFLPDGSIVGKVDTFLVKTDSDLNIIWKTPALVHHDIKVGDDGRVYVISTEKRPLLHQMVRFDVIEIFSPEGNLLYKWGTWEHLDDFLTIISKSSLKQQLKLPFSPALGAEKYISQNPKLFLYQDRTTFFGKPDDLEFSHFNSIQVLPDNEVAKSIPAFKKGNLLLSFNYYHCFGILDISTSKIIWAGYLPDSLYVNDSTNNPYYHERDLQVLHTPLLTDKGTILAYLNTTHNRPFSSITEFNPITGQPVWEYTASPRQKMSSTFKGAAEKLANGNILVTDISKGGRCFELTPQKEIVWDWACPLRDEDDSLPWEFYRSHRLNEDLCQKFLTGFRQ
jgi:hypothetical protein